MSDDIVNRLRAHVNDRGGPSIENGGWQMMLDAADDIEVLQRERDWLVSTIIALDALTRGKAPLSAENLVEIFAVTLKKIRPAKLAQC
jgi:hypothetical protein